MSRPRKKVLIFSALEEATLPVVFACNTRGMHARAVCTLSDFEDQLEAFAPDVALLFYDGGGSAGATRACENAAYRQRIPSLVASRWRGNVQPGLASITLQQKFADMAEILRVLHVLSQRKRGPKKADSVNGQRYIEAGRAGAAASARLA